MKNLTLGEGNTPLIQLNYISEDFGIDLWAKCEYVNPTGSFKDRGSIVEVNRSLLKNKKGVICASTGNMAASLSAYAARAGLLCFVVVPSETPKLKLQQALACGAQVIKVNGTYDECVFIAEKQASYENLLLCGDYQLRREGRRTVGHEIAVSKIIFDSIVVPVGNGTLAVAIMEGINEKFNKQEKRPKLIGVQSKNVNPIERAWRKKSPIISYRKGATIASAFDVSNPLDGYLVIKWLKKTKGGMVVVSDKEIIFAQNYLAKFEGIYVESTAATTIASIIKCQNLLRKTRVLIILTGSGLKEVSKV